MSRSVIYYTVSVQLVLIVDMMYVGEIGGVKDLRDFDKGQIPIARRLGESKGNKVYPVWSEQKILMMVMGEMCPNPQCIAPCCVWRCISHRLVTVSMLTLVHYWKTTGLQWAGECQN